MPRNGSGVYSKPVGTTAIPNAVIASADYNTLADDLAAETTESMPRSGTAAMTADFPFGGFRGTNLASATALTDATTADQVQDGTLTYAGTIAGTDTYTCTLAPVPASLTAGMAIRGIVTNANTGAATLNVNALGAKSIVKDVSTALAASDISAGELCEFFYDGTNFILQDASTTAPTEASTTEVLTGTDTAKHVTPNALAALWESGSNIASAGTISIGEGSYLHITGTVTITDIDFGTDKSGRRATLVFDGILTLTHNATSLILPGGANIVTAAGDIAEVVSEGSDNVRCISYTRATPIVEYDKGVLVVGTTYTQAHGQATYPANVSVQYVQRTTDLAWSVGDRLDAAHVAPSSNGRANSITVESGGNIEHATGATNISFIRPDTNAVGILTPASWDVIFVVTK